MANTPNTLKRNNEEHPGGSTSFSSSQFPGEATSRIGEAASQVAEKAREAASNAGEKASEIASDLKGRAEQTTAKLGSGMRSFADSIREHSPSSGMLGSATGAVADTLESGGRYLEREGIFGLGHELTHFVRRNPIPAICIGFGLGFLIARAARR